MNRPGVSRKAAKIADGAGRISGDGCTSRTPVSHSSRVAASTSDDVAGLVVAAKQTFLTMRIIP